MLVEKITSKQNPLVKRFRRVRMGLERGFVFIEGVRLLEEALRAGTRFESVAFTPSVEARERGGELLEALRQVPCRGANVSPQVMQNIADTKTPQGVAAIVSRPYVEAAGLLDGSIQFVVIADHLQDPGNLGTVIRTAEAAGATGLITTRNSVDPFSQKSLRASMGSAFRLPIATGARPKDLVSLCQASGLKLITTRPVPRAADGQPATLPDSAERPVNVFSESRLTEPFALVLGGEAEGVSAELSSAAAESIFIPMASPIESLNVASAAAIILMEAARQRQFRFEKGE